MRILYSPQRSDQKINYAFEEEKISVTLDNITDTFDFSAMADGKAKEEIETSLSINPIISAERKDGILSVILINYIGKDATKKEKFPTWQEV
ncbi:MAG: hypothetical protein N4A64_07020 [Marinisporobacter sp.]|nr:hypothetical protein [Marinisporobacter sp.]